MKKELVVSAIENGTVIDHIPANAVFQVVRLLGLDKYDDEVLIGTNLESKKLQRKGIIKIKNKYFTTQEINKISLVAPAATLIKIENYEVIEKREVEIPDNIEKFVKCMNPKCVTNNEVVPTKFEVLDKSELKLRCHYCEKITTKETIRFTE